MNYSNCPARKIVTCAVCAQSGLPGTEISKCTPCACRPDCPTENMMLYKITQYPEIPVLKK